MLATTAAYRTRGAKLDSTDAVNAGVASVITAALAALAYGVRSVILAAFRRVESQMSAESRRYAVGVEGLKRVIQFWEILEAASQLPFIDRILIFSGANGGGTPKPGKSYNVSCNWSYCVDKSKHTDRIYAGPLRVDTHYVKMLLDLIEHKQIELTTSEMHKDSMLRGYYETEGVVQSRVYFLSFDSNGRELLFCTLANYSRKFTPNEARQIDMIVNRLRALMS